VTDECQKSSYMFPCLGILIMHNIAKHDYGLALGVEKEIIANFSETAFSYKRIRGQIFEVDLIPQLQNIVTLNNITCEDCFPNVFTTLRVARKIGQYLCNALGCSHHLKLAFRLKEKIWQFASTKVENLGTLLTAASRQWIANEYLDKLVTNLEGKSIGLSYQNLSWGASILDEKMLALYAMRGIKNFCPNVSTTSCFGGSFKVGSRSLVGNVCILLNTIKILVLLQSMMRIMKENIYQPHMVDLNDMYERNFNGSLSDIADVPSYSTINLTSYELKSPDIVSPIKKEFFAANLEPFLPFCKLANKWSDLPKWGSMQKGLDTKTVFSEFCTLFRPTLTDQGVCYTFNGIPSQSIIKPSEYMTAYEDIFGLPDKDITNHFHGNGIGIRNGLKLILDAHILTGSYKNGGNKDNTFKISLQSPEDFPLPFIEGIEVEGGFKTRFAKLVYFDLVSMLLSVLLNIVCSFEGGLGGPCLVLFVCLFSRVP
jgi:hypothetical protein